MNRGGCGGREAVISGYVPAVAWALRAATARAVSVRDRRAIGVPRRKHQRAAICAERSHAESMPGTGMISGGR